MVIAPTVVVAASVTFPAFWLSKIASSNSPGMLAPADPFEVVAQQVVPPHPAAAFQLLAVLEIQYLLSGE